MKARLILASKILILCMLGLASSQLVAQDKSVTIRGDTESPTVLYLVPWRKTPSTQGNTDFEMELDFEFQPLSRSEVIRKVRYFKEIGYDKNVKTTVNKNLRVIQR